MTMDIIDLLGLAAAITMPLFNIPLIVKIIKRKSSEDISMVWALGVWACIIVMFPSGVRSDDIVWKAFNYVNLTLFTGVVIASIKYRKGIQG